MSNELTARSKLPLYTPTQSLNVEYHFETCIFEKADVVVPAAQTHALLNVGCKEFMSKCTFDKSSINFCTGAVTLLYTDTTTEEGSLGDDVSQKTFHLAVEDKNERVLSCMDFYTAPYKQPSVSPSKAKRSQSFNNLLTQRVNAFSAISGEYFIREVPITSQAALQTSINGPMFHETFHHTEQALMHHLSSPTGIKAITDQALEVKAQYVYGIVLDIYSQRMLCCNCNACLLGLQCSQNQGFLFDLSASLDNKNIQPRIDDKMMLSTRVSVSKPNKTSTLAPLKLDDNITTHKYDPDSSCQVFQALDTNLGVTRIKNEQDLSIKSFKGAFFTSSQIKSKVRLEKSIALPKP